MVGNTCGEEQAACNCVIQNLHLEKLRQCSQITRLNESIFFHALILKWVQYNTPLSTSIVALVTWKRKAL